MALNLPSNYERMTRTARDITTAYCRQVAALPWRRGTKGEVEILLVTSRTNAKWMLPKGWPMPEIDDAAAAMLEAHEEAGIRGNVAVAPIGSYHFIKLFDDGTSKPAQAVIYSLRVTTQHKKWEEKAQRQRRWFSAKKAAKAVFEPDLARFLRNLASDRVILAN